MPNHVLIVDYGVGNLLSVRRAFEHCGATVELSGDPACLERASRVVLPGVGAFGDCVAALHALGLADAVRDYVATGRPLLGICVGMQMLFDASEEFGRHEGLGIIPGIVQAIPHTDATGCPLKIPHIGWSCLELPESGSPDGWTGSILANIAPGTAAYFVHSFTARPADSRHRLADTVYGGFRIAAAVRKGSVIGVQFHPEKSGPAGLAMIRSFLFQS
jgi:glutamine amidotransferase